MFNNSYGFFAWIRIHFFLIYLVFSANISNLCHNLGIKHRKRARLPDNLAGKNIVITGANAGIGKATAKAIVRRGGKVVLACRDQKRAAQAIDDLVAELGAGVRPLLIFVQLDLSSLQSVRQGATEIARLVTHIDVLINNAGVMATPTGWTTQDGFEFQLGTNHLGHFLLTQLLMDRLRAAPDGARIVNVSSMLAIMGEMYWNNLNMTNVYTPIKGYCRSKLANVYFTQELTRRLGPDAGIRAYVLHPGVIRTELIRHSAVGKKIGDAVGGLLLLDADQGAQTTLHCAFHPEAGGTDETDGIYDDCARWEWSCLPGHLSDASAAGRLWELSLELCDVEDHV